MALNLSESALVLKFRKNSAPTIRHRTPNSVMDMMNQAQFIQFWFNFERFLYF